MLREGQLKLVGRYELQVYAMRAGVHLEVHEHAPKDLNLAALGHNNYSTIVCDGQHNYNNVPAAELFGNFLHDAVASHGINVVLVYPA